MKHPGQMKEHAQLKEVYEWLKLKKPTINETASICLPCVKQIAAKSGYSLGNL